MTFHAKVHHEDGSYWAEVEELPGCFASGDNLNELRDALSEAIPLCLSPLQRVERFGLRLIRRRPVVLLNGDEAPRHAAPVLR